MRHRHSIAGGDASFGVLMAVGSFACSTAVANRLAQAYSESLHAGAFIKILQVSRDDGKGIHSQEDAAAKARLLNALGAHPHAEYAIAFIGITELRRVFPNLLQQMRRIKWHDRRRPLWLANGCDLPLLAYHALYSQSLPANLRDLWMVVRRPTAPRHSAPSEPYVLLHDLPLPADSQHRTQKLSSHNCSNMTSVGRVACLKYWPPSARCRSWCLPI